MGIHSLSLTQVFLSWSEVSLYAIHLSTPIDPQLKYTTVYSHSSHNSSLLKDVLILHGCVYLCMCMNVGGWVLGGAGNCVFWYEKSSDVSVKAQKEEYLILFYSFYPFNAVFVLCVLQISVMYVTV